MDLATLRRDPLTALTLIALVPRLLAAFFSAGYFAHDDHFLVIEAARSWVDEADYNAWLPWNQGPDATPSGHSFVYVGLHYLLFRALAAMGANDPEVNMVLVRLLHALWSLVAVRTGYRIALRLGGERVAWNTGLWLALFYFMPFLAVRNLVEVVSIPLLMRAAWELLREERPGARAVLMAGVWAGLAINIRFQTIFFAAGPGLVLLAQRRWAHLLRYGAGVLLPLVVLQGGIDLFIWGRPFAEMTEYVRYNLDNTTTYFDQPWYNYLLLLAGMLLPPFSLAVLFGLFRRPRPWPVWLPVILFLAAHSWFPNKQERFLLPIVPLVLVLGLTSWEAFRAGSAWWQARPGLWRGVMRFTWALNLLLLVPITFTYSKRSRVDAMLALREGPPVHGFVVDDTVEHEPPWMPLYYLGRWEVTQIPHADAAEDLAGLIAGLPADRRPDAVLFIGREDLDARKARMTALLGPLEGVTVAEPGLVDRVVHWLNPVNRNETITVMRTARH
ncbi:MAG: glycosyltransferase family 39 protein [Flavobacteriales bacterium]|nr:hypothetical protein [Flavobacteriales bacterium]MCC6577768.1 glycosyltransferase family 39 protein [Flavobacteriales bacterium]